MTQLTFVAVQRPRVVTNVNYTTEEDVHLFTFMTHKRL